jgi:hypothetical protein
VKIAADLHTRFYDRSKQRFIAATDLATSELRKSAGRLQEQMPPRGSAGLKFARRRERSEKNTRRPFTQREFISQIFAQHACTKLDACWWHSLVVGKLLNLRAESCGNDLGVAASSLPKEIYKSATSTQRAIRDSRVIANAYPVSD